MSATDLEAAQATAHASFSSAASSLPFDFSGQNAWKHMRALNRLRPRNADSQGPQRSLDYLAASLETRGIASRELVSQVTGAGGETSNLTHFVAEIPGRSRDVLLLAAHYGTSPVGTEIPSRMDQNASGPALLLELAHALHKRPVPEYTIWLAWIDGDALDQAASSPFSSDVHLGTQSLVDEWIRSEELARIRAAIVFGNVGHRDQPIVRDINSPRIYREIFWEVAQDQGFDDVFPPTSHYGLTRTGRNTLARAPIRATVALENSGESMKSGKFTPAATPRRRAAGFDAVGNVTLEVLVRTASKLGKIDRFAEAPLKAGRDNPGPATPAE
jgi:glutaminyl-peptide cyclotransferase